MTESRTTIRMPCCGGIHSKDVSVETTFCEGHYIPTILIPNYRIQITRASALKLRRDLERWLNDNQNSDPA